MGSGWGGVTEERALQEAAAALDDSVVVTGFGEVGSVAVEGSGGPDESTLREAAAVFMAVELGEATDEIRAAMVRTGEETLRVVVAGVPPGGVPADAWMALRRLRASADAVLLVDEGSDPGSSLLSALASLRGLIDGVGVVNLDLADFRTVVGDGDLAVWTRARARDSETLLDRAAAASPDGFDLETATSVLLHVTGGADVTVGTTGEIVSGVRERVADDAHVIWGSTVDDSREGDALDVTVVAAGIEPPVGPGDSCPRCGSFLVGYSLGDKSTAFCESCGFSGISLR